MLRFPEIHFAGGDLLGVDELLTKEWLITNGLGGYASSTVLGVNTRKYHGLLVAAFHPPRRRMVCLTKLDEVLRLESPHPLYANEFQCGIQPTGYHFLERFSILPFPNYVYNVRNVRLSKTIFMPRGRNATIIYYSVENGNASGADLLVYPLLACRHFHSVMDKRANPSRFTQRVVEGSVKVNAVAPSATVIIKPVHGCYSPSENWLERIYYREEHARGESYIEDWYQPGFFTFRVGGKSRMEFALIAAAGGEEALVERIMDDMPERIEDIKGLYAREVERYKGLIEKFYGEHEGVCLEDWLSWLIYASDTFIVEAVGRCGKAGRSVIAGYHWFEDWGRDTFISLPGLMLITGRFEDAKQTLLTFSDYALNGLIPNLISDLDMQPDYSALDATLWYINATLQYLKYTGDFTFVREKLWEGIKIFVENLLKGRFEGMRVDEDGLILHGPRMTWMDTMVDGKPVTPRGGKAVEIQALWFNAIKTLELLARRFKHTNEAEMLAALAEKVKASFNEIFWNHEKNCLFDVVDERGRGDPTIRPNQIIAVSLDFSMLDNMRSRAIVDVVRRELLTPYGLRALSRSDPRYIGVYRGDRRNRDLAYHNGTVWPWLLGPFITAYLKTEGYNKLAREYAYKNFLLPLLSEQVFKAGLGTISEIFDGDPPHAPRGCIAQAWSVAEPLRAYVEDVVLLRPRFEREVLKTLDF